MFTINDLTKNLLKYLKGSGLKWSKVVQKRVSDLNI